MRDLFKETVFKVCGAKNFNELPPSVRRVMKEHDYEVEGWHPLSVRRILAVTRAINAIAAEEAVNNTVSLEKAAEFVDGAVAYVSKARADAKAFRDDCFKDNGLMAKLYDSDKKAEVNLTDDQRSMAARVVSANGAGLVDGTLRILANFTVGASAGGSFADEEALSAAVSSVADKLRSVRSFRPGDARVDELNAKVGKRFQSLFDETMANGHNFHTDGFCQLFKAEFGNYCVTVNGERFEIDNRDRPQLKPLEEKLAGLLKQPKNRSAITTLITGHVETFARTILGDGNLELDDGGDLNLGNAKGADLLLGRRQKFDCVNSSFCNPEFTLTLADDGKTQSLLSGKNHQIQAGQSQSECFCP